MKQNNEETMWDTAGMFSIRDKVVTPFGIRGRVVKITDSDLYPIEVRFPDLGESLFYNKTGSCKNQDSKWDIKVVQK